MADVRDWDHINTVHFKNGGRVSQVEFEKLQTEPKLKHILYVRVESINPAHKTANSSVSVCEAAEMKATLSKLKYLKNFRFDGDVWLSSGSLRQVLLDKMIECHAEGTLHIRYDGQLKPNHSLYAGRNSFSQMFGPNAPNAKYAIMLNKFWVPVLTKEFSAVSSVHMIELSDNRIESHNHPNVNDIYGFAKEAFKIKTVDKLNVDCESKSLPAEKWLSLADLGKGNHVTELNITSVLLEKNPQFASHKFVSGILNAVDGEHLRKVFMRLPFGDLILAPDLYLNTDNLLTTVKPSVWAGLLEVQLSSPSDRHIWDTTSKLKLMMEKKILPLMPKLKSFSWKTAWKRVEAIQFNVDEFLELVWVLVPHAQRNAQTHKIVTFRFKEIFWMYGLDLPTITQDLNARFDALPDYSATVSWPCDWQQTDYGQLILDVTDEQTGNHIVIDVFSTTGH